MPGRVVSCLDIRGIAGVGGGALVPGASLSLASCPRQALLSIREVHAAPLTRQVSDGTPLQASVDFPTFAAEGQKPWRPCHEFCVPEQAGEVTTLTPS